MTDAAPTDATPPGATPTDGPPPPAVAVVGGGISGLTAAWRLMTGPRPPRVHIFEAGTDVGGKLAVGDVGPLRIDLGAESVLARRPEAVELIGEAGLADRLVHPVTAQANVVRDGHFLPMPAGTLMGVPGDPRTLHDVLTPDEIRRVAAEPGLPVEPLRDDVAIGSWVSERVGPAVTDRLVEPLLGGVYAGHAARLSLRATVPALWSLAAAGTSLLEGVRRLVPSPPPSPHGPGAHGPGAHRPAPVFAGLDGGLGLLPQAMARLLAQRGATVRTGTIVRGLEPAADGRWRLTVGPEAEPAEFDAVVLAVPARAASRLLARACPAAAAGLGDIEAASVALVAVVLDRAQTAGLSGSGVLVPPVERRPVKAMTFSSAKWGWVDALDDRHAVVRLSLGRLGEEAVLQRDDAELTALALADASDLLGRPLRPIATRVVRWAGSLPQPAVGHVDRIAALRSALEAVPGLAVCGAMMDGVGIPACIAAATSAAAKIADEFATRGGATHEFATHGGATHGGATRGGATPAGRHRGDGGE